MDDEAEQLAQRFMATVPRLMHRLGSQLRSQREDAQLSMAQFRVLAMLHVAPHTLSALAADHEVAPPTMSRLITTLVERGWVTREVNPADRREVIIRPTEQGSAVWHEMRTLGLNHLSAQLDRLTEEERAALSLGLAGLQRVME